MNAGANATITMDGPVALPSGTLENTSVVEPDNTIDGWPSEAPQPMG